MLQGNYFELSPDAQPFLHYWSLSVEEQFYLLFPFLLILILRYARNAAFSALVVLTLISFAANVIQTDRNPVWAFYLLPTRAWELLVGSSIALMPLATRERLSDITHGLLPWAGAILIAVSFVLIEEGARFPGWVAVLPTAGAVALIVPVGQRSSMVLGWLSLKPMPALGRMSFSLYLWHWPVFSLVDYQFFQSPEALRMALKIVLSFLLAYATYYSIEVRARTFLNLPSNRTTAFAALLVCVACAVPLGMKIRTHNYVNAEMADVAKGGIKFWAEPNLRSVVLLGDSNGSMYGKVAREICADLRYSLTVLSVAAGDALPSTGGASSALWLASLDLVKSIRPDYLLIANAWAEKLGDDRAQLSLVLSELEQHAGRVLVLNQPPILPPQGSRHAIRSGSHPPYIEDQANAANRKRTNELLLSFASKKVSVVNIAKFFELPHGEVRHIDSKGRLLYQDARHLSGYGADYVGPALRAELGALQTGPR